MRCLREVFKFGRNASTGHAAVVFRIRRVIYVVALIEILKEKLLLRVVLVQKGRFLHQVWSQHRLTILHACDGGGELLRLHLRSVPLFLLFRLIVLIWLFHELNRWRQPLY